MSRPSPELKSLARTLERTLRAHADPERRAHGASYHPTEMEILAVAVPTIRRAALAAHRAGAR